MEQWKALTSYFSRGEKLLWSCSVGAIVLSALIFGGSSPLGIIASLIGVTALIFMAKANPFGQVLVIGFSLLYGIISYSFAYYGEMLTYLGMTLPMAVVSLITWMRNPFQGNHTEVEVNCLHRGEHLLLVILVSAVTVAFYFILAWFHTANLIPSTISVATSFAAAYLTFRRSPWYAAWYACNDLVLIVLWMLATMENAMYLSMVICFAAFFVNDIYGFLNWRKIAASQKMRQT